MFSRNARLFLSATFLNGFATGIWVVLFNLYLLDLGFREDFIGYMLLLGGLAAGLAAFPVGIICGKVGRKKSLLTGVSVGSIFNVILVCTSNPILLLTVSLFQGFGGLFGILFWVAQAPFMMENSEPEERTHLFSINLATWFLSNMAGSLVGGVLPGVFSSLFGVEIENVMVYRAALTVSVVFLFLAVLPYYAIKEKPYQKNNATMTSRFSLKAIQSRAIIGKLVLTSVLIGLGAGLIVPFFNVFFKNKLQATPEQIGIIFALGNVMTAVGIVLAPVVSGRLGKVHAIAFTQLSSIPFIFGIAFSPNLGFAAVSYLARGALMVMGVPIYQNLAMEVVQTEERAPTSGFITMADRIPRAVGSSIAGQTMTQGNYFLPYMITSAFYFFASSLFLTFFRKAEKVRVSKAASLEVKEGE
ncbi:MAG: MFS transporter [Candidatus Bathyarchaeia archaeon]